MTPSEANGVSAIEEKRHRFFACGLIQEGGILLQLPQVVLATAQSLLHRFYARQSVTDFDAFRVAMGCIFLASKAEEQPRRIKDVIQVFFRMRNRRMGLRLSLLSPTSARFAQWSDWLIMVERQLLVEVGFSIDAMTEHPHKFLLYYVKMLDCTNALAQKAWNYVNDSFRVDLCMRFDAHVIASAAICLAARVLQFPLPLRWEELLEVDVGDMHDVAREMLCLYEWDAMTWIPPLTIVNPYELTQDDHVAVEPKAQNMIITPETKITKIDDVPPMAILVSPPLPPSTDDPRDLSSSSFSPPASVPRPRAPIENKHTREPHIRERNQNRSRSRSRSRSRNRNRNRNRDRRVSHRRSNSIRRSRDRSRRQNHRRSKDRSRHR
jgi:hypothetical protein